MVFFCIISAGNCCILLARFVIVSYFIGYIFVIVSESLNSQWNLHCISFFCTVSFFSHCISFFGTVFRKGYTALSQSELRIFFMYIIKTLASASIHIYYGSSREDVLSQWYNSTIASSSIQNTSIIFTAMRMRQQGNYDLPDKWSKKSDGHGR
jgi:hypothetical protein